MLYCYKEEVAHVDLVKEQVNIATGKDLSISQEDVHVHGAAIEARINAEDPSKNFCPQAGKIAKMVLPSGLGIRIESGVNSGDTVSPFYDSMIVKIIAHATNRQMAIKRLLDALKEFEIKGLVTNRDFLIALLNDDKFQTGTYLTTYIDQEFLPNYLQRLRNNEKEAQVNGN